VSCSTGESWGDQSWSANVFNIKISFVKPSHAFLNSNERVKDMNYALPGDLWYDVPPTCLLCIFAALVLTAAALLTAAT
jgi:hypothetical protein